MIYIKRFDQKVFINYRDALERCITGCDLQRFPFTIIQFIIVPSRSLLNAF